MTGINLISLSFSVIFFLMMCTFSYGHLFFRIYPLPADILEESSPQW